MTNSSIGMTGTRSSTGPPRRPQVDEREVPSPAEVAGEVGGFKNLGAGDLDRRMPTSRGGAGGYHQEHWTPFMVAAERGNLGLCRLLSRHPQFDARRHLGAARSGQVNRSIFFLAAHKGQERILQWIGRRFIRRRQFPEGKESPSSSLSSSSSSLSSSSSSLSSSSSSLSSSPWSSSVSFIPALPTGVRARPPVRRRGRRDALRPVAGGQRRGPKASGPLWSGGSAATRAPSTWNLPREEPRLRRGSGGLDHRPDTAARRSSRSRSSRSTVATDATAAVPVCEKSVDVQDLGLCLLHVRLLRATSKTTTTVRATLRTRGHGSLLSNGGSAAAASLHSRPSPSPGPRTSLTYAPRRSRRKKVPPTTTTATTMRRRLITPSAASAAAASAAMAMAMAMAVI